MQTVLYFLSLHLFTSYCIHDIEKMNNSRFVLYFSFTEIWPPIWFLSSLRRKGHSSKNSNFSFFAFFKWIPHIERLNLFSPTEPNAEVVVCRCRWLHYILLRNHWSNINQTWHKTSLGEQLLSFFKWMVESLQNGNNEEKVK